MFPEGSGLDGPFSMQCVWKRIVDNVNLAIREQFLVAAVAPWNRPAAGELSGACAIAAGNGYDVSSGRSTDSWDQAFMNARRAKQSPAKLRPGHSGSSC